MLRVDLARNYQDYAEDKSVTVTLPAMPRNGDTILLSEESFDELKEEDNPVNNFTVYGTFLCEDYDRPAILVVQHKDAQ